MGAEAQDRAVERWFVKRGLPHFIDGYNAREDIFTRAAPFLLLVFLGELLNAINGQWSAVANLLAVVAAVGGTAAAWVLLNRARGRRPLQRPDDVGAVEIAAFVLVPSAIPLVFGGQVAQAAKVLAANLTLLLVTYVVVSYGLLPMSRWATGQMLRQLRTVGDLMVRSLPLLLLFSMFMFFNAEMWKIADDIPSSFLVISIGVLLAVGSAFIVLRLPGELDEANRFESWQGIGDLVEGTPMAGVDPSGLDNPPLTPALDRRARINVGLVQFVSQSTQILLVTIALWSFYLLFGAFTVIPSTIDQWTGSDQLDVLWSTAIGGHDLVLSGELVRTSLFIAAVAGLQFTVQAVTESAYREEFLASTSRDTRRALAVRALYLATRSERPVVDASSP